MLPAIGEEVAVGVEVIGTGAELVFLKVGEAVAVWDLIQGDHLITFYDESLECHQRQSPGQPTTAASSMIALVYLPPYLDLQ